MVRRVWVVIVCAGGILSLGMGLRQSLGLFLAPVSADLGLGRGSFAFAMALMNLLWGLASPFAGAVADRFGPGRVAALGGLLYAGGLWVLASSTNTASLVWGGALIGMGLSGAGFSVVLGAVARATPPEKRSRALGLASLGGSVGQFLVVPYASALMGSLSWMMSLLILAAGALLMVPLARGLGGKATVATSSHTQTMGQALKEAFQHQGFWLLTAAFFVCGFNLAFIGLHMPAHLEDQGFMPWLAPAALSLIGLFNILGTYACGELGGRFLKKRVLSAIYLARSLVFFWFILTPISETSVIVFSVVIGLLWLGTVPLTSGLVAYIFGPMYMSMLYGIVFFSHQLGSFAGAWLAGYLYDAYGSYELMWWINVGLGLLAAALHWPISERPVARLAVTPTSAAS